MKKLTDETLSNEQIGHRVQTLLGEMRELLVLSGESVFKVRAFEKAAESLAGRHDLLERARAGTLLELEGVGKGINEVLVDFLVRGHTTARDQLLQGLPAGLLELARIPGLGPKKARQVIEELEVHTVAELEYACKENRLLELKGFGEKSQAKILEGIRLMNAQAGKLRLDQAQEVVARCLEQLRLQWGSGTDGQLEIETVGALRRQLEVVSEWQLLVRGGESERQLVEQKLLKIAEQQGCALPVKVECAAAAVWGAELVRTTATPEHWQSLAALRPGALPAASREATRATSRATSEEGFYRELGLPWISPELRETGREVALAKAGKLDKVLGWKALRGSFHNHTHWSDGTASFEEMVLAARALGWEYVGISDHSQSAFYARGLKKEAIDEQERELRLLQEKYPEIRIFWGIESDILADGSLDYDDATLARFDFVVASIHSRFKMDRAAMTERLVRAIRHPATRFVGHLTGRILLGRPGYELDFEKVIEVAAQEDVAIELNANPSRLDIDWRWGPALIAAGTKVAINPDAHATEELSNTHYGVVMARKALLPQAQVVNTLSTVAVARWLSRGRG